MRPVPAAGPTHRHHLAGEAGELGDDVARGPRSYERFRGVIEALPGRALYARIDGVERGGRFLVMEVELNAPGLLYQHAPAAAGLLAEAVARWLADADGR